MVLPENYTNVARRTRTEDRVAALESGGGGGGLTVTGTKAAGKIPKVDVDGTTVVWSTDDAGSGGLTVTGTPAVGKIPKVQADGSTIAWDDDIASPPGAYIRMGSNVRFVAASGESAGVKGICDYVCDGTSDESEFNTALAAVGTETIGRGTNGGQVIAVGRRFTIGGPILMQTQTHLTSQYGEEATQIRCASTYQPGNSGGMIQLATVDTQYVTVDHLTLDGQGYSVGGLYISQADGQEYDAYHKFSDLYIWNCGGNTGTGDAISMQNASGGRLRGCHLRNIRVLNAGRYGCYINGPDSFYTNIDIGSSGSHGFYVTHANNRIVGCKSWFSDGSGYYFTTASRDNQVSACESQDNLQHGYHIQGARNSFSSCCADSNSYDGSHPNSSSGQAITGRTYHGFNILGNYTCVVGCTASDKNESGRGARQVYGVYIGSGVSCIVKVTTTGNYTGPLSDNSTATRDVTVIGT